MRKTRRRSKRFFGYGFISENIMNLLKKAGAPVAKAMSSAIGSKIGNKIADKIMPGRIAGLRPAAATAARTT